MKNKLFSILMFLLFTGVSQAQICGIFAMDSTDGACHETRIRTYPFVDGYLFRYLWKDLEPSQGMYNFSSFDCLIPKLDSAGLKMSFGLTLWLGEPQYIVNTPGVQKYFNYMIKFNCWRPVPWDTFALQRWDSLWYHLSNHQVWSITANAMVPLKNHPVLAYINPGMMGGHCAIRECPPTTPPTFFFYQMPGYTRTVFMNSVERQMHSVIDNFHSKNAFTGFWSMTDSQPSPPLWDDLRIRLLIEFNGVNNPKLGLWRDDLSAYRSTPTSPIIGIPNTTAAIVLFNSSDSTNIEFQMYQRWRAPYNPPSSQYTVPSDAIKFAYNTYNARYHEIYTMDLDYAYNNPTWDDSLQIWHDLLKILCPSNPNPVNENNSEIPREFSLLQNYPNPFNPTTHIKFGLPNSSFVKLTVIDILGKEVTVLVNEKLNAGKYEADWDGTSFASGVYYYKLTAGDFSETRKMVLLK